MKKHNIKPYSFFKNNEDREERIKTVVNREERH